MTVHRRISRWIGHSALAAAVLGGSVAACRDDEKATGRVSGDYLAGSGNVNPWGPTPGGTYPALANIPGHPGFNGQAPPPVENTQFFPVTRLTIYAGLEVQFDP